MTPTCSPVVAVLALDLKNWLMTTFSAALTASSMIAGRDTPTA
jgi:hypothetical protein